MRRSGGFFVSVVSVLMPLWACEFGVTPVEGEGALQPSSQTSTLAAEGPSEFREEMALSGTSGDPIPSSANPEPAKNPVPTTPVPCIPTLVGSVTLCLPAPQTADRSHGDPQPWQPSPVPQPH